MLLQVALIIVWVGLGWLAGGLLSVLAVELPAGRVRIGATCPHCGAATSVCLRVLARTRRCELCSSCGGRVREPWPLVEVAASLAFGLLAWRFGWGWPLGLYSGFAALLVLVAFIDLRHRLILDVVTLPGMAAAFALGYFTIGLPRALMGGATIGGVYLALYVLAWVIYRHGGALGLGDVKLALLVGLVIGAPAALIATLYSALAGALMAIGLLAAGRGRSYAMPYGPSLVVGALVTVLLDPTVWT